jgi:hypothetical protein
VDDVHIGAGLRGEIVKFGRGDSIIYSLTYFLHHDIEVYEGLVKALDQSLKPYLYFFWVDWLTGPVPLGYKTIFSLHFILPPKEYEMGLIKRLIYYNNKQTLNNLRQIYRSKFKI